MKILLSPAKELLQINSNLELTIPVYLDEAEEVHNVLSKLSKKKIVDLMKISDSLASKVQGYIQSYSTDNLITSNYSAIESFNGMVYKMLGYNKLSAKEQEYINSNLLILSGQYGLLKPLDRFLPYRMEMGRNIMVNRKKLVDYWKDIISLDPAETYINLASIEYSKAVNTDNTPNFIDIKFWQEKDGKISSFGTYNKMARGMMCRELAKSNISTISELEGLQFDGYSFLKKVDNTFEFIKKV